MDDFAHLRARLADEEVEVHTAIGLQHGIAVELHPAARRMRRQRLPLRLAPREFVVGHVQVDQALADVDLDQVMAAAVKYQKLLELNANPARLDLNDVYCAAAKRLAS